MAQSSYDEVPYSSLPIRRSHPSHLAAIARIFGLRPASPGESRVLELGCASGGNLLPLAIDFPCSHFVGIDLSVRQIAEGQSALRALGLTNLELHALDVQDFSEDFGLFDFIICHGVFSWVPRNIQEKILEIARSQLTTNGVAYVSYNTYPGWHLRGVVRDMMAFHVRGFSDPQEKVAQARALLGFLTEAVPLSNETYRRLLSDEATILKTRDDGYLYHEHLEDVNEPLYFYEFLDRVVSADLQYLGDTDLGSMLPQELGDGVTHLLKHATLLQQEQYLDFLRNRMFRGSLLCQGEVALQRQLDSRRLIDCDVGLEERLELPSANGDAATSLVCETSAGRITVRSPLARAALYLLQEVWPGCISFQTLLARSRSRARDGAVGGTSTDDEDCHSLARDLFALYLRRLIRVWVDAPACSAQAGTFPVTTPLARWQAARGNLVCNRRHETLQLSDLDSYLLARLDGRHDRTELQAALRSGIACGELVASNSRVDVSQLVESTLVNLAEQALLIGPSATEDR